MIRTAPPTNLRPAWHIAVRGLLRPWGLGLATALAALPVLWSELGWLGISARDTDVSGLLYDVAFVGSLFGGLLGLARIEEWGWATSRWQPLEVLRHEAVQLALPALALAAAPLVWGLAGPWHGRPLLQAAAGLALARPVAVGLALRRVPLPAAVRGLALLAVCWWIPAILAPSFPIGLGPAAQRAAELGHDGVLATPGPWVAETSMLLALLLAARLGLGGATRRT
jgi:hypothetical protein